MKDVLLISFLLLHSVLHVVAAAVPVKVEPPFWWTGMKHHELQLMVYGDSIAQSEPSVHYDGVIFKGMERVENANYLFLNLLITENALPGDIRLVFSKDGAQVADYLFTLHPRNSLSGGGKGFDGSDVLYLLMPDRFANGDPANDNHPDMAEKADRNNPDGRHGGDIEGIINRLDYIANLGITALWINPLLENNNPKYSYHGYAITDFYRIDPRFGSNQDYLRLVQECRARGLKVIADMVFNHCSTHHPMIHDLPSSDWINRFDQFTRSNFRGSVLMDPYASEKDKHIFLNGWFDTHMADLNQRNSLLANYLIQNTIWWIEYAGIDGIRVDTQPYSFPEFMSQWSERVFSEYPDFMVVGEAWLQKESFTSWFQKDSRLNHLSDSGIPVVTDFPLYYALNDAFTEPEDWTTGLAGIYYVLAQDFMYAHPMSKLIFCDNHDLTRYYSSVGENLDHFLMGMTFLLTTRGIPMLYYGSEILMTGFEHHGHGEIRKDFPGGWPGDPIDLFDQAALNESQRKAFNYLSELLAWRKSSKAAAYGTLTHFIPEDGVYVYFRKAAGESYMVVINKNKAEKRIETIRFEECLTGYSKGRDVVTGNIFNDLSAVDMEPVSALVIELSK